MSTMTSLGAARRRRTRTSVSLGWTTMSIPTRREQDAERRVPGRRRRAGRSSAATRSGGAPGPARGTRATRSRPSCFITDRSCVGLAMPRVAAKASAISSGVKNCSARSVHALGVGAHGEDEHHVGEVDGLPPRRRADLREGHVDEHDVAVLDQQVGRLDVAVSQPAVPEPADHGQALVDHAVVDLGVADLLGAVEELGDEQVLALGRELHDARRRGRRDAGVAHQPQRVVLVLHQPPDALERRLVLEAAVEDGASRPCTSGRPGRGSWRRASRTGTCRGRPRPAGAAASNHPSLRARRA